MRHFLLAALAAAMMFFGVVVCMPLTATAQTTQSDGIASILNGRSYSGHSGDWTITLKFTRAVSGELFVD